MFSVLKPILIDLGIDLGTANTIVYADKRGYVVNEPSVIALDGSYRTLRIGAAAKELMGKTGADIKVIRPMEDGVIADFRAGETMIKEFIKLAGVSKFRIGRVVMGVPTGITEVEKRAIIEAAEFAGAREVHLVAEPMAAAIGIGLDIQGVNANMIVDIGGGTTDIAVINYGGVVLDNTIRIAGDELNEAVIKYLKSTYNLKVGELTAERIKIEFGDISDAKPDTRIQVKGLNHLTGLPTGIEIPLRFFKDAFNEVIGSIVGAILKTLERLPEELSVDIIERGIVLTGGGALLNGLDEVIRQKTNLPVSVADNPLLTVAIGTERILKSFKSFENVLLTKSYR